MAWFADGVALGLAALFGAGLVHKLLVVRAGVTERDPLLRRGPFGPRLNAGAAAVIESATVVALAFARTWGLLGAALLLSGYAWVLRGLGRDTPCHCFAASSRTRAGVAMWRNAGLGLLAGLGALAATGADRASSSEAIAVALLMLACIGAIEALEGLALRTTSKGME